VTENPHNHAVSYLPGALPPAADPQGSSRIWSLREAQALLEFMGLGGDERQQSGMQQPGEADRG
jgi:hypothetical protein